MENNHHPGWFARPEKFVKERTQSTSQTQLQRGMINSSQVRSNEGQG